MSSYLPQWFKLPSRKLTVFLTAAGLITAGILVLTWRKKRKHAYDNIYEEDLVDQTVVTTTPKKPIEAGDSTSRSRTSRTQRSLPVIHSNGDISKKALFSTPRGVRNSSNVDLETIDSVSTATMTPSQNVKGMNAEQLSELGLEALNNAIHYWEDALDKMEEAGEHDTLDTATHGLQVQLRQVLQQAHRLQELFEERLFQRVNAGIALDAALLEMNREYEERRRANSALSIDESSTDQDSFYSTYETADLSDLDEQRETFHYLSLYYSALADVEQGTVPCRVLRTKLVGCTSDAEYLAKLCCIRQAFAEIFKEDENCSWFINGGRQMLSEIISKSEREPEEFQAAYDALIEYVKDASHWSIIEDELRGRGVKMMNFYDIALDFILFDAFDDLESPPVSVVTVMQNRWLSNGFKETALSTAVWSVLKAKRRLLKYPNGFIGHFYTLSEYTSPPLVWGFLGPPSKLKNVCNFFKDQSVQFSKDIFNFNRVRYTTVSELASDILRIARDHFSQTLTQLAVM